MAKPGNADANGQPLGHLPASPAPAGADAIGNNVPAFDYAPNRSVSGPGSKFAAAPSAHAEEPAGQAGGRRRRKTHKSHKGKGRKTHKSHKGKGRKTHKSHKGKGKSRKGRKGHKTGRRTRSHRGGGIIGTYLNRLLGDDQGPLRHHRRAGQAHGRHHHHPDYL
jgi:hypothetical protein